MACSVLVPCKANGVGNQSVGGVAIQRPNSHAIHVHSNPILHSKSTVNKGIHQFLYVLLYDIKTDNDLPVKTHVGVAPLHVSSLKQVLVSPPRSSNPL